MKKTPPRFFLSQVFLLLLLPLLSQVSVISAMIAAALLEDSFPAIGAVIIRTCVFLVVGALFVWCAFITGKKIVQSGYFPKPTKGELVLAQVRPSLNFFFRYLAVVLVSSFTAIAALVAIFLPAGKGAVLGNFVVAFSLSHLPSAFVVSIFHGIAEPSNPWKFFIIPALIYVGFGAGMAWQFHKAHTPRTRLRGGLVFGALLAVSSVVFALRLDVVRGDVISGGKGFDDRNIVYRYHPWSVGNQLVHFGKPLLDGNSFYIHSEHPRLDGATALYPIFSAVAAGIYQFGASGYESRTLSSVLKVSTTPDAYKNLLEGNADIIFAAKPSSAQLAEAKACGVEYQFTPLGREAFVFFVNKGNPVKGLTSEQVRGIYTRRITDWSKVGGKAGKILAFQRPADSGSQTVMEAQVMRKEGMSPPLEEERAELMSGIVRSTAAYRNTDAAIGYSFRFFVQNMMAGEPVRLLAIDGVEPTVETIRNGKYPYGGVFYAVTTSRSADKPNVKKLIAWLQSEQGQQHIENTGYVRLGDAPEAVWHFSPPPLLFPPTSSKSSAISKSPTALIPTSTCLMRRVVSGL